MWNNIKRFGLKKPINTITEVTFKRVKLKKEAEIAKEMNKYTGPSIYTQKHTNKEGVID